MLKDLLAIVDSAKHCAPFLANAVSLAERHGAHLTVVVLTSYPLVAVELAPFGSLFIPEDALARDEREKLAAVRSLLERTGISFEVRGIREDVALIPRYAGIEGRYADLVLFGTPDSYEIGWLRRRVIETEMLSAGSPLMILPTSVAPRPINYAVLGWNASPEAGQVARDLVGLAEPGARIDVVAVDPRPTDSGHGAEPGSDIARHLARHGFEIQVHVLPSCSRPVADVLQGFARMRNADLLAIGAYAHSRVREVILGGVTRELIEESNLPILMSH
jgi:nucleotide-binding universal stress UspA family protein